jgi:heat shock protein HslJ
MEQEAAFLATLNRAATYEIAGNRLQIEDEDGLMVLTFSELKPEPLVGTPWKLAWYDNGKGGLASTLAGTQITALFGDDGTLTGSAGCNSYSVGYQVTEAQITIGPAASTMMQCPEPEGLMEQEFAYLAALETATLYEIEGDELRLLNAEGLKAAVYAAMTEAAALSMEALQNAAYQTEWTPEGTVRLQRGEYRAPAAPGSASKIVVALTEHVVTGELNGEPAATVILYSSGGGSGTFYELHIMVERDGQPRDIAWTKLGDRVQINALAIEEDDIMVDMVAHGPDDPMCCPTQQVVQRYVLQGEALVQTSE